MNEAFKISVEMKIVPIGPKIKSFLFDYLDNRSRLFKGNIIAHNCDLFLKTDPQRVLLRVYKFLFIYESLA